MSDTEATRIQALVRPLASLIYQCPGCWSYTVLARPENGGWIECECGERMTLIDLRARTQDGSHAQNWHEDER